MEATKKLDLYMNSNSSRETILPVFDNTNRPLWSVMIPTYNCANYLRETLKSVLVQDLGPELMQIEVIDDCSTKDNPREVVEEIGQGRINFYQQPKNVGHIKNFQTCLNRSRGHLVHLLHGDDCVLFGFYNTLQQAFEQEPAIGAAFCRHVYMDEQSNWKGLSWLEQPQSGILDNWLERIAVQQRIQTPSIVVRREVYEKLGSFDNQIRFWGEDWEMWIRIASQYPVWYESKPLALYRTGSSSLSGRSTRSGENIQDARRVISISKNYLPKEKAEKLAQTALRNYSLYALKTAKEFIKHNDLEATKNQATEAVKCDASLKSLYRISKLGIQVLKRQIKCLFPNKLFSYSHSLGRIKS